MPYKTTCCRYTVTFLDIHVGVFFAKSLEDRSNYVDTRLINMHEPLNSLQQGHDFPLRMTTLRWRPSARPLYLYIMWCYTSKRATSELDRHLASYKTIETIRSLCAFLGKQEYIPVGCVPTAVLTATRCHWSRVCLCGLGEGVCLWSPLHTHPRSRNTPLHTHTCGQNY